MSINTHSKSVYSTYGVNIRLNSHKRSFEALRTKQCSERLGIEEEGDREKLIKVLEQIRKYNHINNRTSGVNNINSNNNNNSINDKQLQIHANQLSSLLVVYCYAPTLIHLFEPYWNDIIQFIFQQHWLQQQQSLPMGQSKQQVTHRVQQIENSMNKSTSKQIETQIANSRISNSKVANTAKSNGSRNISNRLIDNMLTILINILANAQNFNKDTKKCICANITKLMIVLSNCISVQQLESSVYWVLANLILANLTEMVDLNGIQFGISMNMVTMQSQIVSIINILTEQHNIVGLIEQKLTKQPYKHTLIKLYLCSALLSFGHLLNYRIYCQLISIIDNYTLVENIINNNTNNMNSITNNTINNNNTNNNNNNNNDISQQQIDWYLLNSLILHFPHLNIHGYQILSSQFIKRLGTYCNKKKAKMSLKYIQMVNMYIQNYIQIASKNTNNTNNTINNNNININYINNNSHIDYSVSSQSYNRLMATFSQSLLFLLESRHPPTRTSLYQLSSLMLRVYSPHIDLVNQDYYRILASDLSSWNKYVGNQQYIKQLVGYIVQVIQLMAQSPSIINRGNDTTTNSSDDNQYNSVPQNTHSPNIVMKSIPNLVGSLLAILSYCGSSILPPILAILDVLLQIGVYNSQQYHLEGVFREVAITPEGQEWTQKWQHHHSE